MTNEFKQANKEKVAIQMELGEVTVGYLYKPACVVTRF